MMLHPGMFSVVMLSLGLLTWFAWYVTAQAVDAQLQLEFDVQVEDTRIAIEKRLHVQERALLGGKGLFAASKSVERDEWKAYVDALKLEDNYPGMQGIGYSEVIKPSDLTAHVRALRAQGFPDYDVRPPGTRDIYTAIVYLEPFDWRNQRAFGFDMFSEPVRREAMERARDSGDAAMSGKVTLVQETKNDIQNGFLIYLPIYRKNVSLGSVEQRRNALLGYVYSAFRIKDLMIGTQNGRGNNVNFAIHDGTEISSETLLYTNIERDNSTATSEQSQFTKKIPLVFAGNSWLLVFLPAAEYATTGTRSQPLVVAGAGIIIDLMLIILFTSMLRQHKRSIALTARLESAASSSEAHVQAIANTVIDGIITIDEVGTIEYINPAVTAFFGYGAEELYGKNIKMLMPEPYHSQHDGYLHAYQKTNVAKVIGIGREVSGLRRDGTTFPIDLAVNTMSFNGRKVYVGLLRDISDRVATSKKLISTIKELEERARESAQLSALSDILQTCKDLDEVYRVVSMALPKMLPECAGVLYATSGKSKLMELVCQWGVDTQSREIERHDCMAVRRGIPYLASTGQAVLRCQHFIPYEPDVSYCVPLLAQGAIIGMLSLFDREIQKQAVSTLMRKQQQDFIETASKQIAMAIANLTLRTSLEQQSIHDALTGLHNRRFIQEMLPREIQRSLRNQNPSLAVLMMDIDHFKKINDTYSHAAGDRVLIEVAHLLSINTRREDLVSRHGGEEFLVVMPNIDAKFAVERADRIRIAVKSLKLDHNGIRLPPVTISIGIAMLPEHGVLDEQLLHYADQALYAAKAAGRDRVILAGADTDSAQVEDSANRQYVSGN